MEPILSTDSWVEKINKLYSDSLFHFGVGHDANPPGRGSGRYEFGSGDRIFQRNNELYSRYHDLAKSGMSEVEIAKAMGFYKKNKYGVILRDENGEPYGNTSDLRARMHLARNYIYNAKAIAARELRNTIDPETGKFYTNKKIGELLSDPDDPVIESTVRNWIKNDTASRNANKTQNAADTMKALVDSGKLIDVGSGSELDLGISPDRMKFALNYLQEEGYTVHNIKVAQAGMPGQFTTMKVLCPPGMEIKELYSHLDEIVPLSDADGQPITVKYGMREPVSVDQSRIGIRYAEDGGKLKDGMIEIRAVYDKDVNLVPASEDLSLGNAKYAQVRIAVDGGHYIKGMAVYNPDLPEGTDILVNSNKSVKDGMDKALKSMDDTTNGMFGTTVIQSEYAPGKLSAINIVSDIYGKDPHVEGSYDEWSRNTPAQFLSKQSESLIKQQLKLKVLEKQQEYDEIISITNPVVRKKLLIDFADGCDAAAVDLKGAALPGQRVQVLLSVPSLKENEAFSPNFDNGTSLALIRFPHTGAFEIPIVKVNNTNKDAIIFMKDAKDAIGINPKTAEILSGADFDGDTVIAIPMTRKNSQGVFEKVVNIKGIGNGQEKLPGMEGFDPQSAYPARDGMKVMTKRAKGIEMGVISNLITDMSIKGCEDPDELARAVKYSMVVIDAEKHKLDYTKAEKDYRIKELKEKYQSNADGTHGVSTIISRAKSEEDVPQRALWSPSKKSIDPNTGEKIYRVKEDRFYPDTAPVKKPASAEYKATHPRAKYERDDDGNYVYETNPKTGKTLYAPTGKINERMTKSTRMGETKDARKLMSDNPSNKEIIYADFANKMKAMANESRKEYLATPKLQYNPEAKKKYAAEVKTLDDKLVKAKQNSPKERWAQRLANQQVRAAVDDNPNMTAEEKKRLRGQKLTESRQRTGANKQRVVFTEKEWEAINAGAISESKLQKLLDNADTDSYRTMALPKSSRVSASTANRVQSLLAAGWTRNQIVDAGYASMETVKEVQKGNYEK